MENSEVYSSLNFRSIYLKKISDKDYHVLYKYRNSESFIDTCTNRPTINSQQDFEEELKRDFSYDRFEQYMIHKNDEPIGTIFSYNYSSRDKYLFITTYIDKPNENRGCGTLAFLLLSSYYFKSLSLFKIYVDIYSNNKISLNLFIKRKLSIEGLFYRQRLYKGIRTDVFRFAIYNKDIECLGII